MSVDRVIVHDSETLALKVASRKLVKAAGGGEGAGATCGARQQRMSDCGLANTPDFLTIREVAALEDVTVGAPGWPHVTRALAQRGGFLLVSKPIGDGTGPDCLAEHLSRIATESADTIRQLAGAVIRAEAMTAEQLAAAIAEGNQLCEAAAELVAALERDGGKAPRLQDTS